MTHLSLNDTAQAALADREEDVRAARGSACVNGDTDGAVRGVLESGGHRERRSKLPVNLRLGCTRSNGTPGYQVSCVLRADRVQELATSREAHLRDVEKQGASCTETFVYLETAVHLRVVDEPLPSDCRSRLFEVDAHDDVKVLFCGFGVVAEEPRVFFCRLHIVDRARSAKQLILSICAEF